MKTTSPTPPTGQPSETPSPAEGSPVTPPPEPSNPPLPCPAPPAVAKTVLEGTKSEKEASLEKSLKDRETRISELEDENRRLKTPPDPSKGSDPGSQKKGWLEGATFFG